MNRSNFPIMTQIQVRHATIKKHVEVRRVEEMPAEKRGNFHMVGRGAVPQEGAAKKSSSALATTASTCQVPGGTSLLVGCVLGKTLTKPKQQARGTLKRRLSEHKDTVVKATYDNVTSSADGKGRNDIMTVPRSMSINCPRMGNPSPIFLKSVVSNWTSMTHLFDKVASVTDCRSTGHFVLPKRKVEVYRLVWIDNILQEHFPPLSKPGGVWMTLVDASGKEWSFEFCFWHSKDSRIYYFKKFYPYVQATDLRGGDTVYFSRLEPEGTLFMGCRKQEYASPEHTPAVSKDVVKERMLSNGDLGNCSEDGNSMFDEITPLQELLPATISVETAIPGYTSERLTYKRKKRESPLSLVVQRRKVIDHLAIGEALIEKKTAGRRSTTPEAFQHVDRIPGSLGSKGKRLRVNLEEYCAWEETQDLLRAPPGAIPTVVNVEGHDFEEYKEPPILIKRTYYSAQIQGDNQWVKCDDCGSWRKLPADAFVPARWICSDNVRDLRRAHCSAPQELNDYEIDQLLGFSSDTALYSEYGTESEEEMYDDEYASPESPLAQEQYYHRQPKLRGRTHGARHKHISHLDLGEKCKSYSSGRDSFKHVASNAMQSSGYREYCLPSGRSSHSLSARRSSYIPNGAGKGHQMCTGCDGFIGSAAQACKQCGTLTEYGARRKARPIVGSQF